MISALEMPSHTCAHSKRPMQQSIHHHLEKSLNKARPCLPCARWGPAGRDATPHPRAACSCACAVTAWLCSRTIVHRRREQRVAVRALACDRGLEVDAQDCAGGRTHSGRAGREASRQRCRRQARGRARAGRKPCPKRKTHDTRTAGTQPSWRRSRRLGRCCRHGWARRCS